MFKSASVVCLSLLPRSIAMKRMKSLIWHNYSISQLCRSNVKNSYSQVADDLSEKAPKEWQCRNVIICLVCVLFCAVLHVCACDAEISSFRSSKMLLTCGPQSHESIPTLFLCLSEQPSHICRSGFVVGLLGVQAQIAAPVSRWGGNLPEQKSMNVDDEILGRKVFMNKLCLLLRSNRVTWSELRDCFISFDSRAARSYSSVFSVGDSGHYFVLYEHFGFSPRPWRRIWRHWSCDASVGTTTSTIYSILNPTQQKFFCFREFIKGLHLSTIFLKVWMHGF